MKRVLTFLMIAVLSATSFSCRYFSDASQSTYSKYSRGDDLKKSKSYVYGLISAINEKNPEKLQNLISKSNKVVYSEDVIYEILNLFPEKIKDPKYPGKSRSIYTIEYGKYQEYVYDRLILQTEDGQYFYLSYGLCSLDDYYERNEGFLFLEFYDAYGIAYEKYVPNDSEDNSFIVNKGTLPEGFSEVRRIYDENGDDLLFYRNVERETEITRESVADFLKKEKSYAKFVECFGEPNMIYTGFYYAWETQDGNYIKLYVDDNDKICRGEYCTESSLISRFGGIL